MARPQRTCLGCGAKRDKAQLVRLSVAGGRVVIDPAKRRPGRGGYLCPELTCMERFLNSKEDRLRRVFRSGQPLCLDGLRQQFGEAAGRGVTRE